MPVCKICGKDIKNPNDPRHVKSKFHQEKLKQSKTGKLSISKRKSKAAASKSVDDLTSVKNQLKNIEKRLEVLEIFHREFSKQKNKTKISGVSNLLDIIKQKLPEISKNMLGIEKVSIGQLYNLIKQDHEISETNFTKGLLKLNDAGKIQLESGSSQDNFSIKDNYGNVFKLIRLLK